MKKFSFGKVLVYVPSLVVLGLWAAGPARPGQDATPLATYIQVSAPTPTSTPFVHSLEKAGADFLKERSWLADLYSWNETFDLDRQDVQPNKTGAYCVGNGRAFALIGLSSPLWNWSNLYGDSYQEPDMGGMTMNVTRSGSEMACPKQTIGWVKRSGVVRVRARGKDLMVETYDFAPVTPSENNAWDNPAVLVRMVRLVNTSAQEETDLEIALKIQPEWNVKFTTREEGRDLVWEQEAIHAKRKTFWRLGSFDIRGTRVGDGNLFCGVHSLKPGEETWVAFYLASADSSQESASLTEDLRKKGPVRLLDETRNYYADWFEKGTSFSGDPRTADLFEIESLIFKAQQSYSGGFSPVIGYTYSWIRDNNGPIRWFLKTGHTQEARRAMDFFYGVASTKGSLPNSVPVDFPLDYRIKDLSHMKVEHAETPNWIVLQYWWYYLATGDIDLIRERWNYLMSCVIGQLNVDDKYFFQRDETYLWCLEARIFNHVTFPNYFLSTFAFSADSSFELVSAADHLAFLGKYLEMDKDVDSLKELSERVRTKAEATYWNPQAGYWEPAQSLLGPLYKSPFANILLNPLWCGYARNDLDPMGETPDDTAKAVLAIKSAYPLLGREDGFWKTTPSVDFFVGMNPGQLLYDFCKARLPWADRIYPAVLKSASPSGDFAEMYDGHYHPWNPPVLGVGNTGRVRPWEGGINTESLLEYLTGFSPDAGNQKVVFAPHMPKGMQAFRAQNLCVGPAKVTLDMKRLGTKAWKVTLHLEKGDQLNVTMDFWASRRIILDIATSESATWDKALEDTAGREGRCSFTLGSDNDYAFTIKEDSYLPNAELETPAPKPFQPDPYDVTPGDLLLLTSPTAVLNRHNHNYKYVPPEKFVSTGRAELDTVQSFSRSVEFLDLDMPVSPQDLARGLLDKDGNPKFKLAVFGREAFSPGKQHFKPKEFWADPALAKAVKDFLVRGGCLYLGPAYTANDSIPDWLTALTQGGWADGEEKDDAVFSSTSVEAAGQKLLDEISVADPAAETNHAVTWSGFTKVNTRKLPEYKNEAKVIRDKGRGITGFYQFTVNTQPGSTQRVWARMDTDRAMRGLALMIQSGDEWKQVGVRTQDSDTKGRFESIYFDVPADQITQTQTTFRLVSKDNLEVGLFRLWVYFMGTSRSMTLGELVGFSSRDDLGKVNHGLIPRGSRWKIPVLLSHHPDQAALMVQKIGKGYLIRSELSLENAVPLLRAFLSHKTLENLDSAFPDS